MYTTKINFYQPQLPCEHLFSPLSGAESESAEDDGVCGLAWWSFRTDAMV